MFTLAYAVAVLSSCLLGHACLEQSVYYFECGIVKVSMYVAVFLVSSPFRPLVCLIYVLYCFAALGHNSQIPKPMRYVVTVS